MLHLKKIFKKLSRLGKLSLATSRRRKIALAVSVFLAAVSLLAGWAFINGSPEQVALLRIRESLEEEGICRDSCLAARQKDEESLLSKLRAGSKKLERQVRSRLLDPAESEAFRAELLDLLAEVYGSTNPPSYLREQLSTSDQELKALLLETFTFERDPSALAASYFGWLGDQTESEAVKLAAVAGLSRLPDKKNGFRGNQVETISALALGPETGRRLRPALVLLLGDYYPLFPKETLAAWQDIYSGIDIDPVSRAFAADFLIRFSGRSDWALPTVSEADWAEYYNN